MDGAGTADSLPPLTVFLHKEHYQSLQPLAGCGVQDREVREQVTGQRPLSKNFQRGLKDGNREIVKVNYPETAEEMNDAEGLLSESGTNPDTATRTRYSGAIQNNVVQSIELQGNRGGCGKSPLNSRDT